MTDRFDRNACHADVRQSELGDDTCIAMAYVDGQRVPDFESQPICIDHLATHTFGLPREATNQWKWR